MSAFLAGAPLRRGFVCCYARGCSGSGFFVSSAGRFVVYTVARWERRATAEMRASPHGTPGSVSDVGRPFSPKPACSRRLSAGPVSPEIGSGSASGSHAGAATYSSPTGNGSAKSYSANAWAVNDYWQFQVSTVGYTNITLSYDQTSSATSYCGAVGRACCRG